MKMQVYWNFAPLNLSNVFDHTISHDAASYSLHGKKVNAMLELINNVGHNIV